VCALATGVALKNGLGSTTFAVCVALAMIVMYDAAGVRQAASAQARIINQILDELFQGHPISEQRLKELLGHTRFQVLVGALMGILGTLGMWAVWGF
jgi:acid phosphatase family membrane protein YuiD